MAKITPETVLQVADSMGTAARMPAAAGGTASSGSGTKLTGDFVQANAEQIKSNYKRAVAEKERVSTIRAVNDPFDTTEHTTVASFDEEIRNLDQRIQQAYARGLVRQYGDNGYTYTYYTNQSELDELDAQKTYLERAKRIFEAQETVRSKYDGYRSNADYAALSQVDKSIADTDVAYGLANGTKSDYETSFLKRLGLADFDKMTNMSSEEVGMFNYLYRKFGSERAYEYFRDITPFLNERKSERLREEAKALAEVPVVSSVVSLGTNVVSGLKAPVKFIGALTGDYDNDWAYYDDATIYTNTIRQERGQAWDEVLGTENSNIGSVVYSTLMSLGDMGVALLIAKGVGAASGTAGAASGAANSAKVVSGVTQAVMSSQAASGAMMEARERGLNRIQITAIGVGAAAIEALTEKYALDELLATPVNRLSYFLRNTASEGLSEGAANILNTLWDEVVSGNQSALKQQIVDRMAQGMSYQDAAQRVFCDKLAEIGTDTLAGALAGGLAGGVGLGLDSITEIRYAAPGNKKNDLSTAQQWVVEKFGSMKNSIQVKGIGNVSVDFNGIVNAIENTADVDQAVAYLAMQKVIRRGANVASEDGSGVVYAAPVYLNGSMHTLVVSTVKVADEQYTVNGLTMDGELIYDGTAAQAETGGETKIKDTTDDTIAQYGEIPQGNFVNDISDSIKPQNGDGVNTQYMQDRADYVPGTHEYGRIGVTPTALDRSFAAMGEGQRRAVLDRLAQDAGVQIEFDETLPAEGQYRDGVITVNPNTATPMSVIKHELTHYLEQSGQYNDFMNFVLESRAFKEWRGERSLGEMRAERIRRYAENGVTLKPYQANQEIVADFVGERLFRDVDALAELAQKKRNLFQRIYDWFVGLIQKHRGTPVERELRQMEQKFKEALHNIDAGTTDGDAKYSIQQDANGEDVVVVDTDQGIFLGVPEAEYSKVVRQYFNERFRGVVLPLGENGDTVSMSKKLPGEYAYPHTKLDQRSPEYRAKMKAITELDNLLRTAKKSFHSEDTKGNPEATDGWDYYEVEFLCDGMQISGLINIANSGKGRRFYDLTKIKVAPAISEKYVATLARSQFASRGTTDNHSVSQKQRGVNTQYTPGETKYSIVTLPDGRKYVKADRQVIHGDDPAEWAKQVKRYIDSTIRKGKDVIVYGADGDPLTITDDTSGKARFRNFVKLEDGSKRLMTDEEYAVKLRAETHIDELAEASTHGKRPLTPDEKNHPFAKDGFDYRTAYFMDKDGQYYRITMSVGVNGEVNTIYNVGKLKEAKHPDVAQRPTRVTTTEDELILASDTTISQKQRGVNSEYMPEDGKYSFAPTDAGLETFTDEQLRAELSRRHPKENPLTIAQLAEEDADTTPTLTRRGTGNRTGDGQSAFAESLQGATIFDERLKTLAATDSEITAYDRVANDETMDAANRKINEGGETFVNEFMTKPPQNFTAEDVAAGFILMSRYQAVGDYSSAAILAEKLRMAGTISGQTVQMFAVLGRLTPESMIAYAKRELHSAYEAMVKDKTNRWADQNRSRFDLTDEDVEFILNRTWQAAQLPHGRDKDVLLAEICSRVQSKIPQEKGQAYKAWQRTAMLLNPKTQLRNVLGNVSIMPAHIVSDLVGAGVDRLIAKKTGVRTTSTFKVGAVKGMVEGFFHSWDDFARHINTRNLMADRFEISGQSLDNFNEHHTGTAAGVRNAASRVLNCLDRFNSFLLDAGDRSFYQMWFLSSLNGQMRANKVSEPTVEMIEIATQQAMERTWQDNNALTRFVGGLKKGMNKVQVHGYGLGDVVVKFTKTPANLTKAIFDFSPAGLVKALAVDAVRFTQAVQDGRATAQLQRQFVKNLSNAIVGTLLTAICAGLAKAGVLRGKADDDSDVAAFERTVLGIQPYSIKIGNMSFSYDWMQPTGATMAIMADYFEGKRNAKLTGEDKTAVQEIFDAIRTGGQVLFNQSFMQSVQTLFADDDIFTNLLQSLLSDISAPVPQLLSQTAAALDPTVRTTYEYGDDVQTAMNKVLYKIPGARETLAPSVDVLGNEKQQYGNDVQRAIVSFFSVANVAEGYDSKAGDEVYRLYEKTGEAAVIPPQAPNYVSKNGGKVTLDSEQKAAYQKVTGRIATETVEGLLTSEGYKALSDDGKAELLTAVYSYARQAANKDVLGLALNESAAKAQAVIDKGIPVWQYFLLKKTADSDGNDAVSQEEAKAVLDASTLTKAQKEIMWTAFNSKWKYNPYKKRYY